MKKLFNKKGVSLPELLAIIVIMGLIAAIAFPAFGVMVNNAEKNSKATEVKALVDRIDAYARDYRESNDFKAIGDTALIDDISLNGIFGEDVKLIQFKITGSIVIIDFTKADPNNKVINFRNDGCTLATNVQANESSFNTIFKTDISGKCIA